MKTRILKNSGIEWIGQIPKHWEVIRNKYIINGIYSGGTPTSGQAEFYTDDESGIPFVSISDMSKTNYLEFTKTKVTKLGIANKNLKILKPNTIIYSIYATIGEVAEILCPATISQALLALFVKTSYNKQFYKYNLKAMKDFIFFQSNGNTQFNLNAKKILNFYFVLPPLDEQERIAEFLDKKCASIDSSIENLEQKTKSLAQYKKALITQCVTKGLNPKILEFKDSGIPWIRQIPKHWEVTKIKMYYKVILGKMLANNPSSIDDTLENYLSAINIKFEGVNTSEQKQMFFNKREKELYLLKSGDVLISEGGDAGTACVYNNEFYPCYIQNAVHKVITKNSKKAINKFLYYWIFFIKSVGYVNLICNKATLMHFTKEKVENNFIFLPPLNEQEKIAGFLDKKCEKIDNLSANYKEQIKTLKEYKQALIYECVTGKKQI